MRGRRTIFLEKGQTKNEWDWLGAFWRSPNGLALGPRKGQAQTSLDQKNEAYNI